MSVSMEYEACIEDTTWGIGLMLCSLASLADDRVFRSSGEVCNAMPVADGEEAKFLGCCKVAGGSCGGNLLKVQPLTAKWTAHGSCRSNLRLPLGEPVESTKSRGRNQHPGALTRV